LCFTGVFYKERMMTTIFFLAGAPAVGKSTTAHALAARFQKSIHIPVDDLREMVVSGLVLPSGDWSEELVEQLTLARQTVVQMALIYRGAGYTVVIDDFWDQNSRLIEYTRLFERSDVHKILLLPSQQVAEARNLSRSDTEDESEYIAFGIRLVYEILKREVLNLEREGWLVVDTSYRPIEDTVNLILGLIQ
jgi:predicted kinase